MIPLGRLVIGFSLRINSCSINRLPRSYGIASSVILQSTRLKICNDRDSEANVKLRELEPSLGVGANVQKADLNKFLSPVEKGA